jgi:hypothetical protein
MKEKAKPEIPDEELERKRREWREEQEKDRRTREILGVQGRLRCIEVVYYDRDGQTQIFRLINRTGAEVMEFRERVFAAGLMIPIDPGRWRVIPPVDIRSIEIHKQSKIFDI